MKESGSSRFEPPTKRRGCVIWLMGVVFTVFMGLAGCTAANFVAFQFYGGVFTRWEKLTTAPENAIRMESVRVCSWTENQPVILLYIRTTEGGLWKRDLCAGADNAWYEVDASELMGTGGLYPCDEDPKRTDYRAAESSTTGTVVDCQDVTWNWEYVSNRARLVMYSDGEIERWPMGLTLEQIMAYSGWGLPVGLILGTLSYIGYVRSAKRNRPGVG